ncbi:MAG: carbohydrate-binding family V/XII [Longimicrobiales bacterium]
MRESFRPCATLVALAIATMGWPAHVSAQEDQDAEWPRSIEVSEGEVVVYQPDLETFAGDALAARAAVSFTRSGTQQPQFGVIWVDARVETDRDERMVEVLDIDVTRVRFPDATTEQEDSLAGMLEAQVPQWELSLSLDRLLASLDVIERERVEAEGLRSTPPVVLFTTEPTLLVSIDGDPIFQEIEDSGVDRIVNTPFTILRTNGGLYLFASEEQWYRAAAVDGPWELTDDVPSEVAAMAPSPPEDPVDPPADEPEAETGAPPTIVIAHEATELIVTDGEPAYSPLGDALLYVSNSESDVLLEVETQDYFIVLSGRWYTASALAGPWSHVAPADLPSAMAEIPPESDMGHMLLSVPGTPEAQEAVLDHQIPQTSAINRSEATLEVTYDGDPLFERIEETGVEYAKNTSFSVLRVDGEYYACDKGVWFHSGSAEGPWVVADDVPDEVYTIPPSSPVHNVKYVRIYDSTPDVVYVGYYPGYTHSYVYGGTVVYGTGYYYTPWYGSVYYPYHSTWGWHVRYNPWYGWGFGFSYGAGPYAFGIGWGVGYPAYGGWWGPIGYRGYHTGYHRGWHNGYRAGVGAGYRAGFRAGTRYDNTRRNIYQRDANRDRIANRTPQQRVRPQATRSVPNDVFTDRSGNLFKNSGNNWESRSGQRWEPSTSTNRRQTPNRAELDRNRSSRQRGAARSRNFQRSRSGVRGRRR